MFNSTFVRSTLQSIGLSGLEHGKRGELKGKLPLLQHILGTVMKYFLAAKSFTHV